MVHLELFQACYLFLIAKEKKELLLEKNEKMEKGDEKKILRLNAGKARAMWCQVSKAQVEWMLTIK